MQGILLPSTLSLTISAYEHYLMLNYSPNYPLPCATAGLPAEGYSLHSTQDILVETGPKHRMCGPYRRSSVADVWFYGFRINILINLSIIYQYFKYNHLNMVMHSLVHRIQPQNLLFFLLFPRLSFQTCRNQLQDLTTE